LISLNADISYKGKYGYVTYSFNAKIDIPWAIDEHAELVFTVVNILDLNKLPDLRTPKTAADKKTVGCLCCKQGEIDIEFSLPKTGFILGETVNFNININNRSKKDIIKVAIGFIQECVYRAGSHSRPF
jgi:hypothetical protein